jgi:hypothetical protein
MANEFVGPPTRKEHWENMLNNRDTKEMAGKREGNKARTTTRNIARNTYAQEQSRAKGEGFFKKAGGKIKAGAGKVADVAWRNRSTKGRIGVVAAGAGIAGVGGYYAYRKSRK